LVERFDMHQIKGSGTERRAQPLTYVMHQGERKVTIVAVQPKFTSTT
jgi:hypothetical protein